MLLTCKNADNAIRWKPGERLNHLFEQRCDSFTANGDDGHLACVTDNGAYTFRDLDDRANQAARYLIEKGLGAGDRIGLVFDKSFETYVALLAVLKINAAYVPLDAGFPAERLAFIVKDADVKTVLSLSAFSPKLEDLAVSKLYLDAAAREIDRHATVRLSNSEKGLPVDELCYVIYTSGTTGNPKGVAIEHSSICNFVKVAGEVYGYRQDDRVFQGMTIAFDFSVEELWVPLIAGATLVPGKSGVSLVGNDLADYLEERNVTALCCVPTLLATIERDLPKLRFLLVSGEACPQNLVERWHRPGRVMLNAYGPTEATVTATLTELDPHKAVTIGGPLPTYTIVIIDENKDEAVERGGQGEIGIAGIALAKGYLNRLDLTERKFIPDFLGIPNNPSQRIYRTGDLGRINELDEIEFLGRIDTQVKIRGYRIELGEIEAVLLELPQIGQAVVHTYESEPGAVELVAYYTLKQGTSELPPAEISEALRKRLPAYMVPAYFELLPIIPMTTSNKADRKNLPPPKGPRFTAARTEFVAPRNETEVAIAQTLVEVMKVERVSVRDHFFHDLGAHSLLMARFCSAIRKRLNGTAVSMRDVYLHPTIESLAPFLGSSQDVSAAGPERKPLRMPSAFEYYGCGALQFLFYAAYGLATVGLLVAAFEWTFTPNQSAIELYFRVAASSAAIFMALSAIPVALKWVLIGRWKAEAIPIWSLRYFRFWVVKSLVQSAPVLLFKGTPLYNVYLRLLGAKIGHNSVIQTRVLPVCTDLISIGDNTVLRKHSFVLGYKAQANYIYTGPITIGSDAIVGEASVLDIDTAIGDGGQLGHASSLQSGQRVPHRKRYHGSPAQETQADYRLVKGIECTRLRRALYSVFQLAGAFLIAAPASALLASFGFSWLLWYAGQSPLNPEAPPYAVLLLSGRMALSSLLMILGFLLVGLVIVLVVPRVLQRFLEENKTYVLYGFHYFVWKTVSVISNASFFNVLFGDSSFIVYYLRGIGYRLNRVIQTGANFGMDQRHDNPFLCDIGSGTMVSDRLSMINAPTSHSSFQLRKVRIGDNNYIGNDVVFPADAKTGANCLLGTKVMVPLDGPRRENTGLLGSPCFEIPRVVERDKRVKVMDDKLRRALIRKKDRKNLGTIVMLLLCAWLYTACVLLVLGLAFLDYPTHGLASILAGLVFLTGFSILYFVVLERASLRFGSLRASEESMYDNYFLFHERHWKFCSSPLNRLFKGTPFKNVISRLLGVKLGRMVFDDGCFFFDKTLITIGDYANLNEVSMFQGHSLEEGVFKSDHIVVGNGCTLGSAAFVHYGVKIGDHVVIDPDSFVMKGETADANTIWRGNPAKMVASAGAPGRPAETGLSKGAGDETRTCPEPGIAVDLPR
ncbi:MAG: amino acid adenylation domain-containing protein [Planctomycetes bacterium]|nr:amino acid adenylation domain-containing protein [Planctomycetota bacterium]